MALELSTKYPGRSNAPSSGYPTGSAKNETTPGANDGTPLDEDLMNDTIGLLQSLLDEAGITANGNVDSVTNAQYLAAVKAVASGEVPSVVSAFTNDSGYQNAAQVLAVLPTLLSQLTNDLTFQTEAQIDAKISSGGSSSVVGVASGTVVISDTAYHDLISATTITGIGDTAKSANVQFYSHNSGNYSFAISAIRAKGSSAWNLSFGRSGASVDVGTATGGEFTSGNFSYKITATTNTIKLETKDAGANLTVEGVLDAMVF